MRKQLAEVEKEISKVLGEYSIDLYDTVYEKSKKETICHVLEIIDKADKEYEIWALKFQKVRDWVMDLKGEQE